MWEALARAPALHPGPRNGDPLRISNLQIIEQPLAATETGLLSDFFLTPEEATGFAGET